MLLAAGYQQCKYARNLCPGTPCISRRHILQRTFIYDPPFYLHEAALRRSTHNVANKIAILIEPAYSTEYNYNCNKFLFQRRHAE